MSARTQVFVLLLSLIAAASASCAKTEARRQLTERERDSTLGASVIPGGAVVTRALAVSDSAALRARSMDGATSGQ